MFTCRLILNFFYWMHGICIQIFFNWIQFSIKFFPSHWLPHNPRAEYLHPYAQQLTMWSFILSTLSSALVAKEYNYINYSTKVMQLEINLFCSIQPSLFLLRYAFLTSATLCHTPAGISHFQITINHKQQITGTGTAVIHCEWKPGCSVHAAVQDRDKRTTVRIKLRKAQLYEDMLWLSSEMANWGHLQFSRSENRESVYYMTQSILKTL